MGSFTDTKTMIPDPKSTINSNAPSGIPTTLKNIFIFVYVSLKSFTYFPDP